MIKVTKGRQPVAFKNGIAKKIRRELKSFYNIPKQDRKQARPPYKTSNYIQETSLDDLIEEFYGKCAYCETKVDDDRISLREYSPVADFYRPESDASDLDGKVSTDHYWWLAMDWRNVLLTCKECSVNKRNLFPVAKRRANSRFKGKAELRSFEEPFLLDPTSENVQEHFDYSIEDGLIHPLSERAEYTIGILGLNRMDLVQSRRNLAKALGENIYTLKGRSHNYNKTEVLQQIADRWEDILNLSPSIEYVGFAQAFLLRSYALNLIDFDTQWIHDAGLYDRFWHMFHPRISMVPFKGVNFKSSRLEKLYKPIQLDYLRVEKFKSLYSLNFEFPESNHMTPCIGLIGENGAGKSSILNALLKTLLGKEIDYAKLVRNDITNDEDYCRSAALLKTTGSFVECEFDRKTGRAYWNNDGYDPTDYVIMAFGPFRHSQDSGGRERKFNDAIWAHNFFKPYAPLRSSYKWLFSLKDREFDLVARSILDLLMLTNKATLEREGNEIMVIGNESLTLDQLSDGYKSMISLGCNIMEGLFKSNQDIKNASGLVIIDELGANLHPQWKMRIVKRLRDTFPYVQFVISTHDPLCLKGFDEGEIVLVKQDKSGRTIINQKLPSPDSYRVDELLTSPMFGLSSTIDPDIEAEMVEYYELLANDERTYEQDKRLMELKGELKVKNHLGNNYRENLLFFAIDEILAKRKETLDFNEPEIEKEVALKALEIFDKYDVF